MHIWWAWTPGLKVEIYEKSLQSELETESCASLLLLWGCIWPASCPIQPWRRTLLISSVLRTWPHAIFLWVKFVLCPLSSSFCVHSETLCGLHAHSVFHACVNIDQRSVGGVVWAVLSSPDPALLSSPLPTHWLRDVASGLSLWACFVWDVLFCRSLCSIHRVGRKPELASYFCKWKFTGVQTYLFIFVWSMTAFKCQHQDCMPQED